MRPGTWAALLGMALASGALAQDPPPPPPGTVRVPGGPHTPLFPGSEDEAEVWVQPFRVKVTPVTNAEFLAFVVQDPRWRRGSVPALFADAQYLARWAGPLTLGEVRPDAPVVQVSWHAARAWCRSRGGDLPTTTQWEYLAEATATAPTGARDDPELTARVLAWYGRSGDAPPGPVGQSPANFYGVQDLLGLVWEWTLDFDSQLMSADVRESGDEDDTRFCGTGAASATDPEDYASFMRYAYRSSLKAPYTTTNLGFRCVWPN